MPKERQDSMYMLLTNEMIGKQKFFSTYLVEEGVPLTYAVIKVVSYNVNIQKMQSAPDVFGEERFDSHVLSSMTSLFQKMNKKFYIFAVNKELHSIASALVKNHGEKQATQIISKQRGESNPFVGQSIHRKI
ncbi:MAG: hypothetical protein EZS28_013040 [Streblomastix strix]|uniref:Uncharacterized protein n=1 Tax=Streblomastix strix TaxID=222440 RepID=A0A5J4W946_9EUKA|nr:MAG: hypothetical protein EZS28_013040 [Streblomastix strix]